MTEDPERVENEVKLKGEAGGGSGNLCIMQQTMQLYKHTKMNYFLHFSH